MLLEVLVVMYFCVLVLFCFTSHCIYYCVLLVVNALLAGCICYVVYGFSWYSLLLCLVYIGGVYILFIFVSVFSPNSSFVLYSGAYGVSLWVLFGFGLFVCSLVCYVLVKVEFRSVLCSAREGWLYLCLCLTLVFGFLVLSIILRSKVKFYR
ncbi:NADH dehydrogenase subunit 6 [Echinococcus multilocularis]|uniref:NADH dehydrogenase subunit 6 n=1 Tax=Echinococcus multilocularis TaxID=6211 RepID=A0A068Y2C1_ECHMU|nr:NADH dehydrogenase subunit 6 [Echinococcus multilocularis]